MTKRIGRPPVDPIAVFWSKVRKTDTCWLWTGAKFKTGYGVCNVRRKVRTAHRYSYEINVGPLPPGLCVCHHCDTRFCIRPEHLFLGTYKENVADMNAKGRGRPPIGHDNGASKLTGKDVAFVFANYPKISQSHLAARFGVTQSAISRILSGENWKYFNTTKHSLRRSPI